MEYNDLLPSVSKPSWYLGNEINAVNKDENNVVLNFALAFPDLYEIGSSHFGIQILYDILNKDDEIFAQRVFVPSPDMSDKLKDNNISIGGLETKRPLKDFDIIGFSLLYELNYTGVLEILDLGNIPFYAKDRDYSHPIVIAGGPCMVNPEPVADFFDLMFVGDGEEGLVDICEIVKKWKKSGNTKKEDLLFLLKDVEGVYIPKFFKDNSGENLYLDNIYNDYEKVNKRLLKDLEDASFPTKPVIPFGKPVHDRLRLEISRGCTRGCRFCQAGMIYRPVRERSINKLLEITKESIDNTGYEDLSLLSLSTGDYTCFPELLSHLMNKYRKESRSVSLPSIRAGRLTSDLMEEISKVRKTGFTIAPEAGSQRLRDVINKDLSEQEIVSTVESAFKMGWQLIKLYFMVGLPTETKDDLDGLIELVKKLKFLSKSKKNQINVSITTFIPKSHTPFQWEPQLTRKESMDKFLYIKNNLKIRGIRVKWQDPEHSLLEGLFARGDRRLSSIVVKAYQKGCRLDGWSEHFKFDKWMEIIDEEKIEVEKYIGKRDIKKDLPWDKIDTGLNKKYLIKELENSLKEVVTKDCRIDNCSGCGVCDFKEIYPKVFNKSDIKIGEDLEKRDEYIIKLKIKFKKRGDSRLFGHLELLSIIQRTLDRTGVKFDFTKGFHPKPKIKFRDTLPLGVESDCEIFLVDCFDLNIVNLIKDINKSLPTGLIVNGIEKKIKKYKFRENFYSHYTISGLNISEIKDKIDEFNGSDNFEITLVKKGKDRIYNLKDWFNKVEIIENNKIYMKIFSENGKTLRPEIFLKFVTKLDKEFIQGINILKISETDVV